MRARVWHVALAVAGGLASAPAWAHSAFGDGRSLASGALHLLTSPLSLAALMGLVLALAGLRQPWPSACAAIAAMGAALGAALPQVWPAYAAPAGVVAVGLYCVAGLRPSPLPGCLLGLSAGVAAGIAADLDTVTWPGVIGLAGAMLFVPALLLAGLDDLLKLPRVTAAWGIVRRVLGSWISAIGLLLGALALRSG